MVQPTEVNPRPFSKEHLSYNFRLQKAFSQIPNRGIITNPTNARKDRQENSLAFSPWFLEKLSLVNANCKKEQVCDHGPNHLERTARNGLALADMMKTSSLPLDSQLFSDESIVFTLFMHDLGYATSSRWLNKDAVDHQKESLRIFDEIIESPGNETVRAYVQPHISAYRQVIGDTNQNASYQDVLFSSLIRAADKADYFHADRLKEIDTPASYNENPYYFLANMITDYRLNYSPQTKTLTYNVQLQEGSEEKLELWQKEVKKYFPQVFESLEDVAKHAGVRFLISMS